MRRNNTDEDTKECRGCRSQELIYYNVNLFNPTSAQPIPAAVSDTRGQAVIDIPDEWDMSVVRFDVSANLLPPMVLPMPPFPVPPPPVVLPALLPSLLSVTLTFLAVDHVATVNINTISRDTYGFVFSFDELTRRINVALAAAFATIVGPSSTDPPVLVFDAASQMFVLYYQATYVTAANRIEIWLNAAAYRYVESLPAFFAGYNQPNGKDYRIQVEADSAITLPAVGAREGYPTLVQAIPGEVRSLTQSGPSLASCNGVRSIIITTTMPIIAEGLPGIDQPFSSQNANYSTASLPILSDFLLSSNPKDNPVQDRIVASYLPTAEYRMVQLRGRVPITRVDLTFLFALFDGTVRRMFIPPGGYLSAKLLFRRVVD